MVSQGEIVADRLVDYLSRHQDMEQKLSLDGAREFTTTDDAETFNQHASLFFGEQIFAQQVVLGA